MGNWAELPEDILVLIAKKITLVEDFLFFSGVCRSWRSVATNDNFKGSEKIPWLMLSEKDKPNELQFVSQRKGSVIRTVNLPQARGTRCLETLGWLVTLAEDGEMNLLHPFTRVQINLPHATTFRGYDLTTFYNDTIFIHKAVLSTRPEEGKDYVLVVIYGWSSKLAFSRPEVDMSWHDVGASILSFRDVIFHDGLFYGVKGEGMVFAFDVWGPYRIRPWLVPSIADGGIRSAKQLFIVESAGVILLVALMVIQDSSRPNFGTDNRERCRIDHRTWQFRVFKAILSKSLRVQSSSLGRRRWVEITSLGCNALFLGDNASVSVDASRFPGTKPDCIYYTKNHWEFYRRGVQHTGIYCLEDGSKSPCYKEESFNPVCPPLWVNPSSF